jgi:glycosyltransferase involved in cell wall biosynthesis
VKISIVTVSHNSVSTIADTIKSVLHQTYTDIEHILIDGVSHDGTNGIVRSFGNQISRYVSEPDTGMYDALNKGIKMATGDIIGILNSDDFFYNNNVISTIAETFASNNPDAVYGDVQFVRNPADPRIIRYYSSKRFTPDKFRFGLMPAHPSFYAKRELFEKFGLYKTNYRIGADFELLLRFMYVHRINTRYIEMPFVSMRPGGISNRNIMSNFILNREIARACRENGVPTNYLLIYSKYFRKIFEFFGNGQGRSGKVE